MQDMNDKVTGGNITAAEWNQVPSEMQNVITALGLILSSGDLDQLGKAMVAMAGAASFYADTGAANAYVVGAVGGKQAPPLLNAAADGLLVRFRPANANSGASTINVNGLGAKSITREDGNALLSGDMVTTRDAILRYRQSTDTFLILDAALPQDVVGTVAFRGYIDGFITSNDPGDTANDIAISPGICRDSTDVATFKRATSIVKRLDANWVAGSGSGGFPSGLTRTSGTWYHVFLIRNPSSGVVDAGVDSSLTAVNLLADATGFTQFRRIGSVLTIAGPANKLFSQHGDEFLWLSPVLDQNDSDPDANGELVTLASIPPGVEVEAFLNISSARTGANTQTGLYVSHPDVANEDPTNSAAPLFSAYMNIGTGTNFVVKQVIVRSNTSQQIRWRPDVGTDDSRIATLGWIDPRGGE